MDYFNILHFNQEPFSNSPDPRFFYKSHQHTGCLQKLEVALRLRRGLNVVVGDVGTGKTTLCRQLIRAFDNDGTVETHLIVDPYYSKPGEFLVAVARMLGVCPSGGRVSSWDLKERIKKYLFRRGVDEQGTVILIIDEGQKIPPACLEILREFLNYETNEHKLLQIAIFAQPEFADTIEGIPNFSDRINLYHTLGPLSFDDARAMILFRLNRVSERGASTIRFTYPALRAVYGATGGYPRKIIHLCHRIILTLIIQNKTKANRAIVRGCARRDAPGAKRPLRWSFAALFVFTATLWVILEMHPLEGGFSVPWITHEPEPVKETRYVQLPRPAHAAPALATAKATISIPASASAGRPRLTETDETPSFARFADIDPDAGDDDGAGEPGAAGSGNTAPRVMGTITASKRDMVSAMIARVYGEFRSEYLSRVKEVNPQIKNVDAIEVGDVITFPVIPIMKESGPGSLYRVRLAEMRALDEAYRYLRKYPRKAPPVCILPMWRGGEVSRVVVMFQKGFATEFEARTAIGYLPPDMADRAEVLSRADRDRVAVAKLR